MAKLSSFVPARMSEAVRGARSAAKRLKSKVVKRVTRPNVYDLGTPERVGWCSPRPPTCGSTNACSFIVWSAGSARRECWRSECYRGAAARSWPTPWRKTAGGGGGIIVALDPSPDLRVREADLHGRYRVIAKPSPEGVPEARDAAGGPFDFVLIDGLHMYSQVRRDIAGVLPHLADGAYVLFHDAFHYGVATAIREAVEADPRLHDCGYACRTARIHHDPVTPYNGFRLLRFAKSPVVDVVRVVAPIYAAAGKTAPPLNSEMLDHDGWYCRKVKPCPRCQARLAAGESLERRRAPISDFHATVK